MALRLMFVALLLLVAAPVWATTITTVTVKEMGGVATSNYPLTFGMVFKSGDAPQTVGIEISGSPVTTQTNVKTRWPDGSVRHAVISALVPTTANGNTVLTLVTASSSATTGPMDKTAILATDIGATINLSSISGSGYSGSLSANLRTAINATVTQNYWLSGSVCTETIYKQALNNSLSAEWETRFYPGTPYIRISHTVENVNTSYRGDVGYTYNIAQGNTTPITVKTDDTITHLNQSRWRKVFWLGTAPSEVEIHYDLPYLISTGHIPSYDTAITLDATALQNEIALWNTYGHEPYDVHGTGDVFSGFANIYFPATGGRQEIGLLPQWQVMYLMTWDKTLKEAMLRQAELFANAPAHYREDDSSKSFYGHIINIDDRPTVRTDPEYAASMPGSAIGTWTNAPWHIDFAHQSSFDYLPYLITGDKFYLDELYYWAGYNLSALPADPDWGRNYSSGLIRGGQVRADAWMLRNIAHAAVMAPDGDIEKAYFTAKINNSINNWSTAATGAQAKTLMNFPLRNWESNTGLGYGTGDNTLFTASVTAGTSGWMTDFVSLILSHVNQLGINTSSVLDELQKFEIGRFSDSSFNWYNGATYRFPTATSAGYVSTWAQASSLFAAQPTSYSADGTASNYRFVAMAALSQLTGYTNGLAAYNQLKNNVPQQNLLSTDPTWAIVPYTYNPPSAIPGSCGSSSGLSLASAPAVELCTAGTASAVTGTGPWSWSCAGSGGGSTASCSATLLEGPVGNASALVACPAIAGFR